MPLFVACSSDSGNSSIPEIPVDPAGTQYVSIAPSTSDIRIDVFEDAVSADDTLSLYGDNLRFASVGKCKGPGYIIEIPRTGWKQRSDALKAGEGYVACNVLDDGAIFAALYVDSLSCDGVAAVKCLVPVFGRYDRFAVNPKEFNLTAEKSDTAAFIIHPTTYTASLTSGEWAHITPNVAYVALMCDENLSGKVRYDTLILSNNYFETYRIPIIQDK